MRTVVVLPAPLGHEHAVHRAGRHGEADAVDRALLPEGLDEPDGLDGRG